MTSQKSPGPRVLIVTASVGAGHNQAGRAVVDSLRSATPGLRVTLVDMMTFAPGWFRALYAGGFALMMSKFPRLYGLGYQIQNRRKKTGRSPADRLRLWYERRAMKSFAEYLLETRPDLIVHTHFTAPQVAGGLIRSGTLDARQFVIVTDNDVHRWWFCRDVDRWFLPSEANVPLFRKWSVPRENITVSGIPVHTKWTAGLDRRGVLDDWRLPAGKPIVLLTGGTVFTCGPITGIARGILQACPDVCLVVLAGRNKDLLGRLSHLTGAGERLIPVSFTDRVHELVHVCSLMVTKAGGITTAECLAKGTPMVLMNPIPGQESGNARYLADKGAAIITHSPRETIERTRSLLADPAALAKLAENARRGYKPATETITDAILREVL